MGQCLWEGAGSATHKHKASNPSNRELPPTHQHVNTRSRDPCFVCLGPSRLVSILTIPTEVSQSKEAWSNCRFDILTFRLFKNALCDSIRPIDRDRSQIEGPESILELNGTNIADFNKSQKTYITIRPTTCAVCCIVPDVPDNQGELPT